MLMSHSVWNESILLLDDVAVISSFSLKKFLFRMDRTGANRFHFLDFHYDYFCDYETLGRSDLWR